MKVRKKLLRAYRRLLEKDGYLLTAKANERSITHRYAIYVESEFPDFNVDCEFNRKGLEVKRLECFKKDVDSDDTKGVSVYPDVIVHHRGTASNFVVIEAKTSSNNEECQTPNPCHCDLCKLRAYKADLGYAHAFYVIFPVDGELENFSDAKLENYVVEIQ
jgi:hypothetical protein